MSHWLCMGFTAELHWLLLIWFIADFNLVCFQLLSPTAKIPNVLFVASDCVSKMYHSPIITTLISTLCSTHRWPTFLIISLKTLN